MSLYDSRRHTVQAWQFDGTLASAQYIVSRLTEVYAGEPRRPWSLETHQASEFFRFKIYNADDHATEVRTGGWVVVKQAKDQRPRLSVWGDSNFHRSYQEHVEGSEH